MHHTAWHQRSRTGPLAFENLPQLTNPLPPSRLKSSTLIRHEDCNADSSEAARRNYACPTDLTNATRQARRVCAEYLRSKLPPDWVCWAGWRPRTRTSVILDLHSTGLLHCDQPLDSPCGGPFFWSSSRSAYSSSKLSGCPKVRRSDASMLDHSVECFLIACAIDSMSAAPSCGGCVLVADVAAIIWYSEVFVQTDTKIVAISVGNVTRSTTTSIVRNTGQFTFNPGATTGEGNIAVTTVDYSATITVNGAQL